MRWRRICGVWEYTVHVMRDDTTIGRHTGFGGLEQVGVFTRCDGRIKIYLLYAIVFPSISTVSIAPHTILATFVAILAYKVLIIYSNIPSQPDFQAK